MWSPPSSKQLLFAADANYLETTAIQNADKCCVPTLNGHTYSIALHTSLVNTTGAGVSKTLRARQAQQLL